MVSARARMIEAEMRDIAGLIVDGIAARGDPAAQATIRERVAAIFREAGAEARASENIELDLWLKLLFIAAVSAASWSGATKS